MPALSIDQFDKLITSARTLWRWEAQPEYNEPDENEPFVRWLAGEPDDLSWLAGWLDHIRAATSEGRRYERVRCLVEPPTTYQTWSLAVAAANIDAGEDIRILSEGQASELGLPKYDFVIVDDQTVARMQFGPNGFTGAELIDNDGAVARHREWRDLAWQHAITVSSYTSRSP